MFLSYIEKNKTQFLIATLVVLICWFIIYPYLKQTEQFTTNKIVTLMWITNNTPYYIASSSRYSCKNTSPNCFTNVMLLKPTKDNTSNFILEQTNGKYRIKSASKSTYFSTDYDKVTLCAETDINSNNTLFDLEQINDKYYIVQNGKYIGLCGSTCKNDEGEYKMLCLKDKNDALQFVIV